MTSRKKPLFSTNMKPVRDEKLIQQCRVWILKYFGCSGKDYELIMGENIKNILFVIIESILSSFKKTDDITKRPHFLADISQSEFLLNYLNMKVQNKEIHVNFVIPDELGRFTPEMFERQINDMTCLTSLNFCNRELGVMNNIQNLVPVIKRHGIPVHIDISNIIGKLRINVPLLDIDILTSSLCNVGNKLSFAIISKKLVRGYKLDLHRIKKLLDEDAIDVFLVKSSLDLLILVSKNILSNKKKSEEKVDLLLKKFIRYFKQQNVMDYIQKHKNDPYLESSSKQGGQDPQPRSKKTGKSKKADILFFHLNQNNNIPGYLTVAWITDDNLLFSLDPIVSYLKKKFNREICVVDDVDMVKKFIEIPENLKKKIITIELHDGVTEKQLAHIAKFIFDHITKQIRIYN